jgi:azurin
MKNMDFDKILEDHINDIGGTLDFDTAFESGANWAKDLLSSQVKDDYISPEDRRMIYDNAVKLLIAYIGAGKEISLCECLDRAKYAYLKFDEL